MQQGKREKAAKKERERGQLVERVKTKETEGN